MANENTGPCAQGNTEETVNPKVPDSTPMHKTVLCQKCGKRMLIDVAAGQSSHRCPVCKAAFQVFCQGAAMRVVFAPD
jgi:uncharacterized CHY-type Zn-finger protein